MKTTMIAALLLAACVSAQSAAAIELSLEENRAERGTAGFVDMQRLFKASPDASRAREGLEELVRQAEERVNAKKAELLRLRQDLDTLKIEREAIARSTPTPVAPPPAPTPAAKPAAPVQTAQAPKPAPAAAPAGQSPSAPALPPGDLKTAGPKPDGPPAPLPGGSRGSPASDRMAEEPEPESVTSLPPPGAPSRAMTLNLPGLSTGPMTLAAPPSGADGPPAPLPGAEAPAKAPETAAGPKAEPGPAQTPPPSNLPSTLPSTLPDPLAPGAASPAPAPVPAGPTIAQRLEELDGRIAAKQADVARAEAELDRERLGSERSLLDAEGRKTDQVLARLYRAIAEVAKREGVSIVLDRGATLYGHPAVDLTDKVLRQLRGPMTLPSTLQ